jgi:hypothetical protein
LLRAFKEIASIPKTPPTTSRYSSLTR